MISLRGIDDSTASLADKHEARWHSMFEAAKRYHQKHGDYMPQKKDDGPLWYWCYSQRKLYREKRLTKERFVFQSLRLSQMTNSRKVEKKTPQNELCFQTL